MRLLPAAMLALTLALVGCGSDDDPPDPFSVRFAVEQVPSGLTVDSVEVNFALGDAGEVQDFTIDWATGTSRARVLAHPGQKYAITYVFYASGFDIGRGTDTGTLAEDMRVELAPRWDHGKVEAARARRESGVLLPPDLADQYSLALKGRPMAIRIDSAAGVVYTWYVRASDSVIASGTGPRLAWTPPDTLAAASVNVKFVAKEGSRVLEERDWDVALLLSAGNPRITGVITRNDPSSRVGTFTRFLYAPDGLLQQVLVFDSIAPGLAPPPIRLEYAFTRAYREEGDVTSVIRWEMGAKAAESTFTYDERGRLIRLAVTTPAGGQVDSLERPSPDRTVILSHVEGGPVRRVVQSRISSHLEVDSVFAPADDGWELSAVVEHLREGGRLVSRRTYRMLGELVLFASETFRYNGLGALALRREYREGGLLRLERSETWSYDRKDGRLVRILLMDEEIGEYLQVRDFEYADRSFTTAKRGSTAAAASGLPIPSRSDLLERLAAIDRLVPRPAPARPLSTRTSP